MDATVSTTVAVATKTKKKKDNKKIEEISSRQGKANEKTTCAYTKRN